MGPFLSLPGLRAAVGHGVGRGTRMRIAGAMLLAVLVGGCTSVRMVQRDGCWVRQTEKWPKRVTEELGPCSRPTPAWADDRLTRLVQECVAQADYRWQNQAVAAWSRGEPLPPQESEENMLQTCMNEASGTMLTENEALKARVGELVYDRDLLRVDVEKDRDHLRSSHDKLTDALGEAAKKPAPAAVATATSTSDGTATTQSDSTSEAPQPALGIVTIPESRSSTVPAPRPMSAPKKKAVPAPTPAACELRPTAQAAVTPKSEVTAPIQPASTDVPPGTAPTGQ